MCVTRSERREEKGQAKKVFEEPKSKKQKGKGAETEKYTVGGRGTPGGFTMAALEQYEVLYDWIAEVSPSLSLALSPSVLQSFSLLALPNA